MNAHELGRILLDGPDDKVNMVSLDFEGAVIDSAIARVEHESSGVDLIGEGVS